MQESCIFRNNRLAEYVAEIAAQWKTGAATKHSYRLALQRLLVDAIPRATVVNEPARIECGASDILVPRLNGFDILMASYAMAHLKLDMLLSEGFSAAENAKDVEDVSLRTLRQKENAGRVYINSMQYFDNVPAEAWEFYGGGYKPAQKWLKERKGRALSSDDIMHYKSIIAALVETRRLMDELQEITKEETT